MQDAVTYSQIMGLLAVLIGTPLAVYARVYYLLVKEIGRMEAKIKVLEDRLERSERSEDEWQRKALATEAKLAALSLLEDLAAADKKAEHVDQWTTLFLAALQRTKGKNEVSVPPEPQGDSTDA